MTKKYWQAAVLSAGLAFSAQAWAAGAKLPETTVQYDSYQAKISAQRIAPAGAGKRPAIILIHDKEGLTAGMKEIGQEFAAAGYVVFMPDLTSRPDTRKKMGNMPMEQGVRTPTTRLNVALTVADVDAAYDALAKDPSVDATKISAVGIGWGGWRGYKLAADKQDLSKLVIFYGVTPDDGSVEGIKAQVQAHYAQGDFYTTTSSFITKQWLGAKYTPYIYDHTYIGFFGGGTGNVDMASAVGEGGVAEAAQQIKDSEAARVRDDGPQSKKLAMERALGFLK